MCEKDRFRKYSEFVKQAQRKGDFAALSTGYILMAYELNREKKYVDEIKLRMLAFYFGLSDISKKIHVSKANTVRIERAVNLAKIDEKELRDLYFETIRGDTAPRHPMTLNGSYRLMILCIKKKWNKVNEIVANLEKSR